MHGKGIPKSPEHRRKISEALKGHIHAIPTIEKLRASNIGKKATFEARMKMSKSRMGHLCAQETKQKISEGNKGKNLGKHPSIETKKVMASRKQKFYSSQDGLKFRGKLQAQWQNKNNPNWKGGITPIKNIIRKSIKMMDWRSKVFQRDNFTCQKCGQHGGDLHAHHKKFFAVLMQEAMNCMPLISVYDACMLYTPLWDIVNGTTICGKCHQDTHKVVLDA